MSGSIDNLERRCPRLGGMVTWAYCRRETDGRPCFKALDCWWEIFDVADHLRSTLSEAEFRSFCQARPPSRMAGLIDLIQHARRRIGSDED